MSNYKIENLCYCKEHMEVIARWLFNEWGQYRGNQTYGDVLAKVQNNYLNEDSLPLFLVALDEYNVPHGVVGAREHEQGNAKEFTPWLTSLYVRPESRGMGIAKLLINAQHDIIQHMGYSEVYLYTSNAQSYYASLGWNVAKTILGDDNKEGVVMKKEF